MSSKTNWILMAKAFAGEADEKDQDSGENLPVVHAHEFHFGQVVSQEVGQRAATVRNHAVCRLVVDAVAEPDDEVLADGVDRVEVARSLWDRARDTEPDLGCTEDREPLPFELPGEIELPGSI